jgi:hypothetical protein
MMAVYRSAMQRHASTPARRSRAERLRRVIIWEIIIAVPWVPGGVALAMVVTGNAG